MTVKTILVVEDNPIQREGLAFILRQQGYTVLTAGTADEALSWIRSHPPPDLIVLDMILPPGPRDGWYFLNERKQDPTLKSIPVVIMTGIGYASEEWAASLGACCLFRKPLEVESLVTQIESCIGK